MENVLYDSVLGTYLFEIVVITCTIGLHKVKLFVARPKIPPLKKPPKFVSFGEENDNILSENC